MRLTFCHLKLYAIRIPINDVIVSDSWCPVKMSETGIIFCRPSEIKGVVGGRSSLRIP